MLNLDTTILQTRTAKKLIRIIIKCLPYIDNGHPHSNSVSLLKDINYIIKEYNKSMSKVLVNKTRVGNRVGRPKK